jgi:hypothetical protein
VFEQRKLHQQRGVDGHQPDIMKQRSSIFDAKRPLEAIEKTEKHQKHKD